MTNPALCPVWDGYCADPFVLVHEGGYTMYGTSPDGLLANGRAFQTLHSDDLVHWRDLGGALEPLADAPEGTEYWAPEVATAHGRFWMYYSAGVGEVGHHLRVAVSDTPEGPFIDTGTDLTPDLDFAIDPSPFVDDNGSRWLFFATDHLRGERPGTVLAVAPMHTPPTSESRGSFSELSRTGSVTRRTDSCTASAGTGTRWKVRRSSVAGVRSG